MNKQLSEIKEALSKATPGPWNSLPDAVRKGHGPGGWICQMYDEQKGEIVEFENQVENAILIANAPQWLASLVSQVEEMERTWLSPDTARALMDDMKELRGSHMKNEQLEKQVEEMQKTLEASMALNRECCPRCKIGWSLDEVDHMLHQNHVECICGYEQSLKGDKP